MNLLFLSVGAFLGTIARYEAGQLVPPAESGFPLGTWLINMAGCLFLGWFFTRWKAPSAIRLGIGTGFTGAFTTFSTFSVETMHLIDAGQAGMALLYAAASVVGGILFAAVGFWIAVQQDKGKAREGGHKR
ncbi:UNVERIFIED_CONTAM: CrcB protein [Brevibacillus sp. OAP136]